MIGSDLDIIVTSMCWLGHRIQASLLYTGELFLEVFRKIPLLFSMVLTTPRSLLSEAFPTPREKFVFEKPIERDWK